MSTRLITSSSALCHRHFQGQDAKCNACMPPSGSYWAGKQKGKTIWCGDRYRLYYSDYTWQIGYVLQCFVFVAVWVSSLLTLLCFPWHILVSRFLCVPLARLGFVILFSVRLVLKLFIYLRPTNSLSLASRAILPAYPFLRETEMWPVLCRLW